MLVKLLSRMEGGRLSNVVITLTDQDALRPGVEDIGIEVHSLGMRRGRPSASGLYRLVRILRRERPLILQTWLYHADVLGSLAAKIVGIPVCVWNLRVSQIEMDRYPRVTRWALRAGARLSGWPDLVVVNSSAGRDAHQAAGYRPRRWRVIGNGFDAGRFHPDPRARLGFRESLGLGDHFLVGLVARYDPMKDHATFFAAAEIFLKTSPEARFILAGSGVDRTNPALNSMIERCGLGDRVTLLGERADMPAVLPALDLVTLSSAFGEGFSNAVGEAMACGIPCVVTDVGDMARVVGDTGRVVPPRNPEALAAAWRDLESMGREGRLRLGAAARRRIETSFELSGIVRSYERTYLELVEAAGLRRG